MWPQHVDICNALLLLDFVVHGITKSWVYISDQLVPEEAPKIAREVLAKEISAHVIKEALWISLI